MLSGGGGGGGGCSGGGGSGGGDATGGLNATCTVDLGAAPGGVSSAGDSVWASLPGRGMLVRIDATSGAATRIQVGGHPAAIAAGHDDVWVSGSDDGTLARLDPATGARRGAVSLPASPTAIAVDPRDGSVWTADAAGDLTHVTAAGTVIGTPIRINPAPSDIGWGEGWLWAVNGAARGLVRVGQTAIAFDTDPSPVSVTFDQGVWTGHANGSATRFDPRPGKLNVNAQISVASPNALDAVAADDPGTSLWAISKAAKTLYRISYAGPAVIGTLVFDSRPVSLAVAGGSAWVATADGKLVEVTAPGG